MKKLLMVTESWGGGVQTYLTQLCNDMADDFEVYLAFSVRSGLATTSMNNLDPRIKLLEMKYLGHKPITNIINDVKAIHELRDTERKIQPDIIHLHSSIAGGLGRLAFSGRNNKLIYTPHGYAHICMFAHGGGTYKLLEKILGRRNCITLTCCESEDEEARRLTHKTAYIETGLNISMLSQEIINTKPLKKEDRFTVFSLGRARPQKQPELFSKIASLVPEAKFVWIGNNDDDYSRSLTGGNVEVTGWMPRDKALAMASGADAFILCSLGEAIAMSLLENMYLKKLVLVSDVMGNRSVIQDGVNGYICHTAEEYAARIRQAMEKFPEHIVQKAHDDIINRYNTEIMKKNFIDFYKNL